MQASERGAVSFQLGHTPHRDTALAGSAGCGVHLEVAGARRGVPDGWALARRVARASLHAPERKQGKSFAACFPLVHLPGAWAGY
jgi:hypothetical protein